MMKKKLAEKIARRQFLSLSSLGDSDTVDIKQFEKTDAVVDLDINSHKDDVVDDLSHKAETSVGKKHRKKLGLGIAAPSAALVAGCSPEELMNAVRPVVPTTPPATPSTPPPAPTPAPAPPATASAPSNSAEAVNFLTNAQFSASFSEIEDVTTMGYEAWLNRELDKPMSQGTVERLQEIGYEEDPESAASHVILPFYDTVWRELFSANDPVRLRLAFALSQFFVVGGGMQLQFPSIIYGYYWDILKRGVTGNFRELIEEVTLSPAMGRYLSMQGSRRADPATGRRPDENFAREILQLFSIGLVELNINGTPRLDRNGNEIPTYSIDDIVNLAQVFTGWSFNGVNRTSFANATPDYARIPMTPDPSLQITGIPRRNRRDEHSQLEANFLGVTVPANTDARESLRIALDAIFAHPNVGPFFSRQMIQRLVTSNPTPNYVRRVARVFNDNGSGVRGDIRAVFTAILTDPEAVRAADLSNPVSGRLREPMIRFVQWGKTFGLNSIDDQWNFGFQGNPSATLSQGVLRAPSVFNFFRPGFSPAGTAISDNDLVAPEFQISNEVNNIAYINFMNNAIRRGLNSSHEVNIEAEIQRADNATRLVNRINLLLTANQLSNGTRDRIIAAVEAVSIPSTNRRNARENRVKLAIFLTMVSPDYLIKK